MSTLSIGAQPAHAEVSDFYDSIYRDAQGDESRVPWSDGVANPALVSWLNVIAPQLVRCGSRVAVVGCGLGEDARAIASRGYDVTAFDCAPTAIEWARRLDPDNAGMYVEADLFDPPGRWRHRFDLVVEIYTLQALPPDLREDAMRAVVDLMGPHGHLLVICRASHSSVVGVRNEPPYPLTRPELETVAARAGLAAAGGIDVFEDNETPPVLRMRALFQRA